MSAFNPGKLAVRVRIAVMRLGTISCISTLLFILGGAAWVWLAFSTHAQHDQQERMVLQAQQELHAAPVVNDIKQGSSAEKNMRNFYAALGNSSDPELHIKAIFAIAEATTLQLDKGEYKWEFDKNSMTYRYQILLPVKGAYGAIRKFCDMTLQTMPFVSLDELSFKRESIAENALDATLHFTIFLRDDARTGLKIGEMQP